MKTCKTCKQEKETRNFYKNRGSPMSRCMDCYKDWINTKNMISKHKTREEMNAITVDPKEYRLVYFRKEDNRKFLVRRVSAQDYVLFDTVENVKVKKSHHLLRKEFVSDSDNFQRVKQQIELRVC